MFADKGQLSRYGQGEVVELEVDVSVRYQRLLVRVPRERPAQAADDEAAG